MPTSKDESKVEEAKAESKKAKKPERWELADELELLKAQGNPNPDRVAELKKQLAEG
jgi:hypothetical protein